MSGSLAETLRELGQRGILVIAAERGEIAELACTMEECLCPRGRGYFDQKRHPPSDWAPSVDHFPRLKKDGGKLVLGNVRLAHRLCNRVDYAKNHGIKHAKDRARGIGADHAGIKRRDPLVESSPGVPDSEDADV